MLEQLTRDTHCVFFWILICHKLLELTLHVKFVSSILLSPLFFVTSYRGYMVKRRTKNAW